MRYVRICMRNSFSSLDKSSEGHHGFQKKKKNPNFTVMELDQKRTDFEKLG